MDKFILDMIRRLAHIFGGTRELNPLTHVLRISEIHPVYVNIECPRMPQLRIADNPDYDACEELKAKCNPAAFFPGVLENNFPLRAYPVYLVVPWNALGVENLLGCMRGSILFNRVVGPDRVAGPCFDNEMGQWGAVLLKDEIALKNLPYADHDKNLFEALGDNWRDLGWLHALLEGDKVLYKIKK
jgi:hypothetical protein